MYTQHVFNIARSLISQDLNEAQCLLTLQYGDSWHLFGRLEPGSYVDKYFITILYVF